MTPIRIAIGPEAARRAGARGTARPVLVADLVARTAETRQLDRLIESLFPRRPVGKRR